MEKIDRMYRRSKWISKEVIVLNSHTEIYLTEHGKRVLQNLTDEEMKLLNTDLTLGGGTDPEQGIIYIVHCDEYPVYKQWRKILRLFRNVEKRLMQSEG